MKQILSITASKEKEGIAFDGHIDFSQLDRDEFIDGVGTIISKMMEGNEMTFQAISKGIATFMKDNFDDNAIRLYLKTIEAYAKDNGNDQIDEKTKKNTIAIPLEIKNNQYKS